MSLGKKSSSPAADDDFVIRKKAYLLFSKFKICNWGWGWSLVAFFNKETLAKQFQDEDGIATKFALYPRLMLGIFIAEASSFTFDLHHQFFADTKIL